MKTTVLITNFVASLIIWSGSLTYGCGLKKKDKTAQSAQKFKQKLVYG